ncbi:sodium:proton antiporter [Weissella viridescens]|uniref:Sodium:proton antiporter n=1 Tax=Weissella viridescens TaxID=1629 RepID=A0A3P2RK74_WEIVI|nr:Na+/H+ antiporter NhaC family protein [Weissella viridescens]RRG17828.1 sodium:proton antiporter [Weissella viridescens]
MEQQKRRFIAVTGLIIGLMLIFGIGMIHFKLAPYVPLTLGLMVTMIFGRLNGYSWQIVQNQLLAGVRIGLAPIFLFLLIGMIIALWMGDGVISTLLWSGLHLAQPNWFLPAAFVISALIGTAIGSSFTTIATIGVALMGIGTTFGIPMPMLAGAIISGAIFGDKSSPLSGSTNLAASIAGSELFAHIKNMMWTTIPAFVLSLIGFTSLGLLHHTQASPASLMQLQAHLTPQWWSLLLVGLLFVTAWFKIPAIPTLLINVAASALVFLHTHTVANLSDVMMNGFKTTSSDATVQALLNRGGMLSMMSTVLIIILALALGGILTEESILADFMAPLIKRVTTQAEAVIGTLMTGILANFMIGEKCLATILPGELWKPTFKRLDLAPVALSRTLEDSGTVVNYLVPWGVAGSFCAQTLGVPVTHFAVFAIFAWASPLCSMISAVTKVGLEQSDD